MKRTPLKKQSHRYIIIKELDNLIRKIIKIERGSKCELCGKHEDKLPFALSAFHIIPKGPYPRLRFHRQNLLIACWSPFHYGKFCHNVYHHENSDNAKYCEIIEKIKELRGKNYIKDLKIVDKMQAKHTYTHLLFLRKAFTLELKELEEE